MSLLIKNISGANHQINDIGITVEVSGTYDLIDINPADVAVSAEDGDIFDGINGGILVAIDPKDNVTQLGVTESLVVLTGHNNSHYGMPPSSYITDAADVNISTIQTDEVLKWTGTEFVNAEAARDKMEWKGDWSDTDYLGNDVVRDGAWTMVANKDTSERAAPQPNGAPAFTLPDSGATWTTQSNLSVVLTGHLYEFTKTGWVQQIRAWVPQLTVDTNYRFIITNETNPLVPIVSVIQEPVLNEDGWAVIAANNLVVTAGTKLRLTVDALNSGSTNSFNGGWTYGGTEQSSAPLSQSWNRSNQHSRVRIDKTDLDSTNRSAELNGAVSGSKILIIETGEPSTFWEYEVIATSDEGTYVEYTTILIDDGNGGPSPTDTTTITFDVPIPQSTQYVEETGYWPSNQPNFATVTGFKEFNGVDQPSNADSVYGIDMRFQESYISPDWDLVSYTGISGASGGAPVDTTDELPEGILNLYHTEARVSANTDVAANTNHIGLTDNPHSTTVVNLDDSTITGPLINNQALVYKIASGTWENVTVAVPPPGGGRINQIIFDTIPGQSGTTSSPLISPTITDGTEVWTNTITPTDITSLVRVSASMLAIGSNSSTVIQANIFRGTTLVGSTVQSISKNNSGANMAFTFYDTPNSIGELTYSCRVGKISGGTWYINSIPSAGVQANYEANSYSIEEIGVT